MIRSDLKVPVFDVESETDVSFSRLYDRQPDTKLFRLWEIAGTSHFENYGLELGPNDAGNGQAAVLNMAAMQNPTNNPPGPPPPGFDCAVGINTGGSHWVMDAAVSASSRPWRGSSCATPRCLRGVAS